MYLCSFFREYVETNLFFAAAQQVLPVGANHRRLSFCRESCCRPLDHRTRNRSRLVAMVDVRPPTSGSSLCSFINLLQHWRLLAQRPFKMHGDSRFRLGREVAVSINRNSLGSPCRFRQSFFFHSPARNRFSLTYRESVKTCTRVTLSHGLFSRIHFRTQIQASSSIRLLLLSSQPKSTICSSSRSKWSG